MKTYYVYMLRCADDSFYVGITNELEIRLGQHEFGLDRECYTFSRRPVALVHASDFQDVNQAIAWEKRLKGWSRAKKKALIVNNWPLIRTLASCTNETTHLAYNSSPPFDSAQGDKAKPFDSAQGDGSARPSTSALRAFAQDDKARKPFDFARDDEARLP
jgi:putative endonuclease